MATCHDRWGLTVEVVHNVHTLEFHAERARGGAGMTAVAYVVTPPEGRTDKHQYHWGMDAGGMLGTLTDTVHGLRWARRGFPHSQGCPSPKPVPRPTSTG